VKRDPARPAVRFSSREAARARREIERQHAQERRYQELWHRFKQKRDRERAVAPTGGGLEESERKAA